MGDIGVSPAEATYITGFGLILPAAGAYSTSSLVTGKVYAPSYAVPTPANISTAVSDMETAYTDAASRAPTVTDELGAGNIGGLTFVPGVYKWGTNVTIPTNLTLSGGANDVWIFQIAGNLNISPATQVVLAGGAQAGNVFWQVAGQTTLGTTAVMNGNILDQTAIVLNTGAVLNGRALAQSAVTLDASVVTLPSGSSSNSNQNQTNTSNSINAGASITSSPSVTLALSAIGSTEMLISNDAGFAGASWEAYATSKPWVLTSGDGVKTVYAKFRNATGDMSSVVSANVTVSVSGISAGVSNEPTQGCSLGNLYNTSTGALCINNAVPQGCSGGNIYSTSTGALCVNNSTVVNKYNFGNTTLKLWSKGDAVMELQRFLNAKLNLGLVVDGSLGSKTIAVIKQWQTANGLVSDGLIGAKTKVKMNATN